MKKLSLAIGTIILGSSPIMADQVFLDDVIVQGSECVGIDCSNGMNFGFDTIILKENNLRIFFDDTSSSASFPSNDWRITINDSSNGGGSYFSIDDASAGRKVFRIDAGAPSNALRVDSNGDVGIGEDIPALKLHITDGNTPSIRLEQDGSDGFTPQTWDVAGNEANFFIRDATNGSELPLKIKPSATTSSIFIAAAAANNYKVGIGTESPDDGGNLAETLLELGNGAGDIRISLDSGSTSGNFGELLFQEANTDQWGIGNGANSDNFYLYNYSLSRNEVNVLPNGNIGLAGQVPAHPIHHSNGATLSAAGEWLNASSRDYKTDIEELSAQSAMAALENLAPVTYRYKRQPEELTVGFIAEDVPELVATATRKTLSSMDIVAVLTKVVQEQQKTIADLKASVKQLNDNKIVLLDRPTALVD